MKKFVLAFFLSILPLLGQTTVVVNGTSAGWTGITTTSAVTSTTAFLGDIVGDRQTGQAPDDFVGDATHPGFFMDLGTVNGVNSIGFRLYLAKYNAAGYSGNLRVGIDGNADGAVDLFVGPKVTGNASTRGIVFQNATGAGNYSPSTTALGGNYGKISFTSTNYNYQAITATLDAGWVNIGANTNAMLSFDFPTQTLKDAFTAIGVNMTDQTFFNLMAFTSTQGNAINQDLYGSNGIISTARFDGVAGGFGDSYALDGSWQGRPVGIAPTPEPSTYGLMLMSLMAGLLGYRKYKNR